MKNLELICNNGVSNWLEEQKKRWSCPGCGTKFSWYDKTCPNCGRKVYNCADEEKDLLEK
jgi:rRNA maturation endonuclease Nob1